MRSTRPLKTAWLVTWEWIGDHARVKDEKKVVALFNYRWSGERVRDFVEQIYVALEFSDWSKVGVARNQRDNPYRAQFGTLNGRLWHGEVSCGHNPWLRARQVRNFEVVIDDDGTNHTRWEEIQRPNPPKLSGGT
jgi:hypothetical protein